MGNHLAGNVSACAERMRARSGTKRLTAVDKPDFIE
jgi:hypothetical protein